MAPLWSPDGKWIAFLRFSESDLYLIHPDGSDLQKITGGADSVYEQLVGWWPDSSALLYASETQGAGLLKKFDVQSGNVTNLFVVAPVSPAGNKIAFIEKESQVLYGLNISRLDGSDRRFVAPLNDQFGVLNQQWSPDGKWLLVNISDTPGMDTADLAAALINLETCQVIPLPIHGSIVSWIQ